MSARRTAILVAAIAIALVVAQDVYPQTPLYHTWQYALALGIALTVVIVYSSGARRGDDGARGKRTLVAMLGAAVVIVAGLASGLLGPDTTQIVGTPGTVTPVGALGVAAFFAPADAAAIARGNAGVVLRRRNGPEIALDAGRHRVVGESLLSLEQRPAAFLDAWDARGDHLTVTQPNNASFLSPVLLFRERQRIGAVDVPFDTFATPAQHRVVRALYFTPQDLAGFRHDLGDTTHPAVILTASDDAGRPLGITLARSGNDVSLGGVRIRVTIGTYPALSVASAPPTWALAVGILLFAIGVGWSALRPRRDNAARGVQPQGA